MYVYVQQQQQWQWQQRTPKQQKNKKKQKELCSVCSRAIQLAVVIFSMFSAIESFAAHLTACDFNEISMNNVRLFNKSQRLQIYDFLSLSPHVSHKKHNFCCCSFRFVSFIRSASFALVSLFRSSLFIYLVGQMCFSFDILGLPFLLSFRMVNYCIWPVIVTVQANQSDTKSPNYERQRQQHTNKKKHTYSYEHWILWRFRVQRLSRQHTNNNNKNRKVFEKTFGL